MAGGNGISGVKGDVLLGTLQVAEIRKWNWNPKVLTKDYSSNKTGGSKKRISSVRDGSGKLDGVWDPWDPITDHLDVGSQVTLKLYHQTVSGGGAQFWLVPAVIDDLTFDVDIDTGDVQTWSASYSSNGVWTNPTALASTTTTTSSFMPVFETAGSLLAQDGSPQSGPQMQQNKPAPDAPWGGQPHPAPALTAEQVHDIAVQVAQILQGAGFGRQGPPQPPQAA